MKKITFKQYKIRIYTDPKSFARQPEQPMGPIPKHAVFGEKFVVAHMTGYVTNTDNTIRLLVHPDCEFKDLLFLVSHELGHKVEGGFKKNPPHKYKYFDKHEEKAEHYENFVKDAYTITTRIFKALNLNK